MRIELTEIQWLDTAQPLSLSSFANASGLPENEIHELVDYGVLVPVGAAKSAWAFPANQIVIARTASRLRDDFGLDASGLAVALTLLERVRDLEQRLQRQDAQSPHSPI